MISMYSFKLIWQKIRPSKKNTKDETAEDDKQ